MIMTLADLRRAFARPVALIPLVLALLTAAASASPRPAGELNYSPAARPLVAADWQDPRSLPPRFRNHCSYDINHGRWYCANHCGPGYQFYFCSSASFGCCHPGYGYCDWKGHLRCAP
jgi:hypothetical protein